MKLHSIAIALFVSFGLTAEALSNNEMGIKTVAGEANEGVENLRNLFDSIMKDDKERSDTYRHILQKETGREQRAFDRMKEDLRPVRQRNKAPANEHFSDSASIRAMNKRETEQNDDIFDAIQKKDLARVIQIVEKEGKKVTQTTANRKTGAIVAAEVGDLPILKYFVEKNSTLLAVTDIIGNTVLQHAIQKGNLEIVKYIVDERGVSVITSDQNIDTAVHVAAREGQLAILKYFVEEKKADVNVRNINGQTPLFVAAEKPQMQIIKYLLEERKADPAALDLTQDNILYVSARSNDLTVPKYLLDAKKVQFDVNWNNTLGYTVVNWASRFNSTEFVKYMVEQKKADMHRPDERMVRTPLHQAALTNNAALCEFLIKHGAKVDAKDKLGNTPAALATDADVIKMLSPASNRRRRSPAECKA